MDEIHTKNRNVGLNNEGEIKMGATTYIEEVSVYQCNYCGAYAEKVDGIKHYTICTRSLCPKQYEGLYDEQEN